MLGYGVWMDGLGQAYIRACGYVGVGFMAGAIGQVRKVIPRGGRRRRRRGIGLHGDDCVTADHYPSVLGPTRRGPANTSTHPTHPSIHPSTLSCHAIHLGIMSSNHRFTCNVIHNPWIRWLHTYSPARFGHSKYICM